MLLGHRYYDASTGRFLSRDPIQDGYNWYTYCTYCNNDPVNKTDSTGNAFWDGWWEHIKDWWDRLRGDDSPGDFKGENLAGGTPTPEMDDGPLPKDPGKKKVPPQNWGTAPNRPPDNDTTAKLLVGGIIIGIAILAIPETGGASAGLLLAL